jgi:hypothetical protein
MNNVSRKQVRKFIEDPLSYAMLMEDHEIEETIAKLMTILYRRKNTVRGD